MKNYRNNRTKKNKIKHNTMQNAFFVILVHEKETYPWKVSV